MPPIPDYDNWEDDIDYCYEHAAEADCDFSWEGHEPETDEHEHRHSDFRNVDYRISTVNSHGSFSPRAVSPGATEATNAAGAVAAAARVRSPAGSRMSNGTRSGTATPGVTSNFSLPQRAHNRTLSRSSSFGESQVRGFSMSPTFFISAEFGESSNSHQHQQQQQQRQAPTYNEDQEQERGPRYADSYNYDYDDEDDDDDEVFLTHLPPNESGLSATDRKTALLHARSSASTDVSAYSDHSLASSRHKSNGSMNTALTRWTASSACASLDGWQAMGPSEASTSASAGQPQSQLGVSVIVNDEQQRSVPSENDFYEPTSPVSPTTTTWHSHERHRSDADLLMKASAPAAPPNAPGVAVTTTTKEVAGPPKTRKRARTTSRSQNSPQLALFPHIPPTATGRRPSAF